ASLAPRGRGARSKSGARAIHRQAALPSPRDRPRSCRCGGRAPPEPPRCRRRGLHPPRFRDTRRAALREGPRHTRAAPRRPKQLRWARRHLRRGCNALRDGHRHRPDPSQDAERNAPMKPNRFLSMLGVGAIAFALPFTAGATVKKEGSWPDVEKKVDLEFDG